MPSFILTHNNILSNTLTYSNFAILLLGLGNKHFVLQYFFHIFIASFKTLQLERRSFKFVKLCSLNLVTASRELMLLPYLLLYNMISCIIRRLWNLYASVSYKPVCTCSYHVIRFRVRLGSLELDKVAYHEIHFRATNLKHH